MRAKLQEKRQVFGAVEEATLLPDVLVQVVCGYAIPEFLLCSTNFAFAVVADDGLQTWGLPAYGGDSSGVQRQLLLHQGQCTGLYATRSAFALVIDGKQVVTWGNQAAGGNSESVQKFFGDKPIRHIYSNKEAFAAVVGKRKVVTWGCPQSGGDSKRVQRRLSGSPVHQIYATADAFAALLESKRVVVWGNPENGGVMDPKTKKLLRGKDVRRIACTKWAFAAVLDRGGVVTWGSGTFGGDSDGVDFGGERVVDIKATLWAFAALLGSGRVVVWGLSAWGGGDGASRLRGKKVRSIFANHYAFAAVCTDGTVVAWGGERWGGNNSAVQSLLESQNVRHIYSTQETFAADQGNRLVTWGSFGKKVLYGADETDRVDRVYTNHRAFVVIFCSRKVVAFGCPQRGGDSAEVAELLSGKRVHHLVSNQTSFAAVVGKQHKVLAWGLSDP